jgi:hypothetical protein
MRLEADERAIVQKVKEYERARVALEKREHVFGEKDKKFSTRERVIQKALHYVADEKRKLEREKDMVERARALKAALPHLEKRFNELTSTIKRLEARAIGQGVTPTARKVLAEKEKELRMRERGVELEMRRMLEREQEASAFEQRKVKAFESYLREEVEREQQGRPLRELRYPEIHAMIDDAKQKVMQGSIQDASRMIAEIELLVEKVRDPSERRVFEYDIRDLKTSIKLATLT